MTSVTCVETGSNAGEVKGRQRTMITQKSEYFERRAEIELEAAQRATHEEAVQSHFLLAGLYLDKVHNPHASGLPVDAREEQGPHAVNS